MECLIINHNAVRVLFFMNTFQWVPGLSKLCGVMVENGRIYIGSSGDILTINVPLILKVRDIIFFSRAKHIMVRFAGFFEGAETFLTPKLS